MLYASRVCVLKGTKNNKRRVFPCKEGSKLQSLLLEIQPDSPDPKGLIFKSKAGQRMNLNILDKCWRAHDTKSYRYNGVVAELADQGVVPYLKAYSTRHTFATWAIASGASPEKVAYWIGDNVQTVLRYYCHPDVTKAECPDF
ncbi:tyrosine-type recombinase/integrase [Nostoc sp.]|uniref:tyrosine-type recombinase/integrase n=1 Tax=Nostoc sp. TaxID=1180 RepID=UPI002FF9F571